MFTIIIPVFNEQDVIETFYFELTKQISSSYKYKILFVDDGSQDDTLSIIKRLSRLDKRVIYISLNKNYGQQIAIFAGLENARGDAVIVMDCDLQDPPGLLQAMIKEWLKGSKIVLPLRQSRDDSWLKIKTALVFYTLLNLFGKTRLNPNAGEFYLLDFSVINSITKEARSPLFLRALVQNLPQKKTFISYDRKARISGKSKFSLIKMLKLSYQAWLFVIGFRGKNVKFNIALSNILKDQSAAIIGAGFSGLTIAYYLGRLGVKVSLYEASNQIGGLLASELICGIRLDRHYHHVFKNDHNFKALMADLGIKDELKFYRSFVSTLWHSKLYAYNNVLDFLMMPGLNLAQKLHMGFGALLSSYLSKNLYHLTAKDFIVKRMGRAAWSNYWQSYFVAKFAHYSVQISAPWFLGRLKARTKTRSFGREILGYPDGGFKTIVDALQNAILDQGGEIFAGIKISKINSSVSSSKNSYGPSFSLFTINPIDNLKVSNEPRIQVDSKLKPSTYNLVLSTLPPHLTSQIFPSYKPPKIDYLGFVGVVLILKKPFSNYYWINVQDENAPFGVIVEQNNLAPSTSLLKSPLRQDDTEGSLFNNYNNFFNDKVFLNFNGRKRLRHRSQKAPKNSKKPSENNTFILYLGKYCKTYSELYKMDDETIKKVARDWLDSIKPATAIDVIIAKVFREPFAQPIITTKYKQPPHTIPEIPGFYTSSMAHIFPADRGLDEALKECRNIVEIILSNLKIRQ